LPACPHCGRNVDGNAAVCAHCGRTLRADCWNWRLNELRVAEDRKRMDQSDFLRRAFRINGQNRIPSKPVQNAAALNERGTPGMEEETEQSAKAHDSPAEENLCPRCSQPTPEDALFCIKCGQSVASDHAENIERMVFDYVSSRNGEVSMSRMSKDVQLSEQDLLGAIERLKEKKMLAV